MKTAAVWLLIGVFAAFLGCSDDTESPPPYGEIEYHGMTCSFDSVACEVSGTQGGEPQYSLSIRFLDDEGRWIEFSIQDCENDPANLVTAGRHLATGQFRDAVHNRIQMPEIVINYLGADQLSVVWDQVEVQDYTLSGSGYIELSERIEYDCPESIWVGGHFVYPGDPEYEAHYEIYCAPGYFYPAQKIWFECEDGAYEH